MIKFTVTKKDIEKAKKECAKDHLQSRMCPIAQALKRQTKKSISVGDGTSVKVGDRYYRGADQLNVINIDKFIKEFDLNHIVHPQTFTIKAR